MQNFVAYATKFCSPNFRIARHGSTGCHGRELGNSDIPASHRDDVLLLERMRLPASSTPPEGLPGQECLGVLAGGFGLAAEHPGEFSHPFRRAKQRDVG